MKPSKLSFSGPLSPRAWLRFCVCVCSVSVSVSANTYAADDGEAARIAAIVDAAVKPAIAQHRLPGMAVGVTVGGKRYFYNYGQTAMRAAGR